MSDLPCVAVPTANLLILGLIRMLQVLGWEEQNVVVDAWNRGRRWKD
jgi:hypothetical protein